MPWTVHSLSNCARWCFVAAGICAVLCAAGERDAAPTLTSAERAWIKEHPVVRVLHLGSSGPYSFVGDDGRVTGMNVDYLQRIGQLTGLRFEHAVENNWPVAFEALKAGQTDLLASALGRTASREAIMAFTDPYAGAPDVIVTRRDAPFLFDQRELAGLRVGYARTSVPEANGATVVFFNNMQEALHAVARGEVDAVLVDAMVAAFIIKLDGLGNLRLGATLYADYPMAHFGVRKDAPVLVAILNKALAQISQPERNAIRNRWISLDYEAGQRWRRAFAFLAVAGGVVVFVLAVVFVYQRRLARELALRTQVQQELEKAHRDLQQTSQEKSELLHILAHDLRSPLTGLSLSIDLLGQSCQLPPRAVEVVGVMRTAASQMTRLTRDLLDVQAIEEGRRTYRAELVDLAVLLKETAESFHPLAAPKRISVTLRCDGSDLWFRTDPAAVRQVTENLVSNAVKYSAIGSEVRIEARRTPERMIVSVSDNGPGIDAEDRAKLFQKYAPGKNRPTGGEKSTGVGLWIVQRIVTDLRGRVMCESNPGRGTTFTVELPCEA